MTRKRLQLRFDFGFFYGAYIHIEYLYLYVLVYIHDERIDVTLCKYRWVVASDWAVKEGGGGCQSDRETEERMLARFCSLAFFTTLRTAWTAQGMLKCSKMRRRREDRWILGFMITGRWRWEKLWGIYCVRGNGPDGPTFFLELVGVKDSDLFPFLSFCVSERKEKRCSLTLGWACRSP